MQTQNYVPAWLSNEQKKGQAQGMKGIVWGVFAILFAAILIGELGGDIFSNLANLNNSSDTPSWVPTIMTVLIAFGLVFIVWKLIQKYS